MNIFDSKPNNIVSVTQQLLTEFHVVYNKRTLTKNMVSHPYYPSVLTICDCLSAFKIDSDVYLLEKENCCWNNLSFPFISYSSDDGGNFTLVHEICDNQIRLSNEKERNILVPLTIFLATWEGIIIHAIPNKRSGEPGFIRSYIKSLLHRMLLPFTLLTGLGAIAFVFYNQPFDWLVLLMGLLKFIGVGISMALIARQIGSNHPAVKNLCGSEINNGCNAILQSKDARITSWLSWAEVGFYYFSGSFLSLLILPPSIYILYWANIFSVPIIVYSLIYQYRAKKWCTLCCLIQVILGLEFIGFHSSLKAFNLDLKGSIGSLIPSMLCFLTPIIIWELYKSALYKKTRLKTIQYRLDQFRYDADLFSLALNNQIYYENGDELKPIILGNSEPNTIITIISNPYCEPCRHAHIFIHQWLELRKDIQVRIILIGSSDNSPRLNAVQHMIALNSLHDKKVIKNALEDWYQQKHPNYQQWSEKYPVTINGSIKDICRNQSSWARKAGIIVTPTILVNGYKLPEPYQLEDLKYLII